MDCNAVGRPIRPIALQRKNALFACHDAGAQNWAMLGSLIETRKLNQIEPHSDLTGVLTAIVNGLKQKDIDQLIPWKFKGCRNAYSAIISAWLFSKCGNITGIFKTRHQHNQRLSQQDQHTHKS